MPHWLIKSAIHHVLYRLPRRQGWNRLFQKYVTRSVFLDAEKFETKVMECHRHWASYRETKTDAPEFTAFELGTGWFPIIPVGLYLCGASKVWTVDIDPMLRPEALQQMLQYFRDYAAIGKLREMLPGLKTERLEKLIGLLELIPTNSPEALLKRIQIECLALDAQSTPVPSETVDFYLSSAVLEYIPRPVLQGIFQEARRVLVPGGVMTHRLNLIDQFSYFDHSIGAYNFLRFTEKQWRWRNSPMIWQNRMRISDFRKLLAESGFDVIREETDSGKPAELDSITLAPEFRGYPREDLLVLHSFLTARKKP
jgi:SAM-dependent methyltransferase